MLLCGLLEYSFCRARYMCLWVRRHDAAVGFCDITYEVMRTPSLEIVDNPCGYSRSSRLAPALSLLQRAPSYL
jgi:hypothetical protein